MPTFQSNRSKSSFRPRQATLIRPSYADQQTTVPCHACNRSMVPRVISYYGQPLRSICPFCGTTFLKFPSSFQRFMQLFYTRTLSFVVFKWLGIIALGFVLLWFVSDWMDFAVEFSLLAVFGIIIIGALALAELFIQCVERTAAKLSHQSGYYWAAIVLITIVSANQHHDLTDYIRLFFLVMLLRWILLGMVQAIWSNKSQST